MSAHDELELLLPAFAMGVSSEDEVRAVEVHLTECAACRRELEEIRHTLAVLPAAAPAAELPEGLRARIFDMHFTTKETGTGIGLYVARSIVESEGGTLAIAETGPEGTTFAIRVPLADDSDDSPEEVSA